MYTARHKVGPSWMTAYSHWLVHWLPRPGSVPAHASRVRQQLYFLWIIVCTSSEGWRQYFESEGTNSRAEQPIRGAGYMKMNAVKVWSLLYALLLQSLPVHQIKVSAWMFSTIACQISLSPTYRRHVHSSTVVHGAASASRAKLP